MAPTGLAAVVARLREELADDQVVTDRQRCRTYECDGLTQHRVVPAAVVLARSTADVVTAVGACAAHGVPFVARGAGTGLSGGAVPHAEGVLIVLGAMRSVVEIDAAAARAVVEPGVANLRVSELVASSGYYYAPDPSSQVICSIGGNVAENSGGAHCLKHGFTTHHVTGLELVTPDGELLALGGKAPEPPGYDLIGLVVGSEGTLGIVTQVTVQLSRLPQRRCTVLVGFDSPDDAGAATSAVIAAGVLPAAVEMMDALAIEAAEAAVSCRYPEGAGAVLIVELDGPDAEVEAELAEVLLQCELHGAREVRTAGD
ncbi:MAG: FAD-binding oxidoreductase, partial [Actinomycetes bacterium]